jgi:hypothetical protein
LVPGPIEPITNRGRRGVLNALAASRAIRTLRRFSSSTRSATPNSPRTIFDELNVFVSTASQPTSKNPAWIW